MLKRGHILYLSFWCLRQATFTLDKQGLAGHPDPCNPVSKYITVGRLPASCTHPRPCQLPWEQPWADDRWDLENQCSSCPDPGWDHDETWALMLPSWGPQLDWPPVAFCTTYSLVPHAGILPYLCQVSISNGDFLGSPLHTLCAGESLSQDLASGGRKRPQLKIRTTVFLGVMGAWHFIWVLHLINPHNNLS